MLANGNSISTQRKHFSMCTFPQVSRETFNPLSLYLLAQCMTNSLPVKTRAASIRMYHLTRGWWMETQQARRHLPPLLPFLQDCNPLNSNAPDFPFSHTEEHNPFKNLMAKSNNWDTAISHRLFLAQMNSLFTELMKLAIPVFIFCLQALLLVQQREPIYHFMTASGFLVLAIARHYISSPSPVYLLDFSCLKPPSFCRVPLSAFLEHAHMFEFLDKEGAAFMAKVLTQSGQGEETCLPPGLQHLPPKSTHQEAIKEVHMTLFPVFEDLLSKTKISPTDIDILIVNCSGFCPAPSLSSIIVNKYSMREDIKSFTISGMGCSASALAIDMAYNILKTHKNSNAVILSTEILSTGWYPGKEHPMLVLNCLFRMGAAAILVSNKKEARKTAKYKLLHTLRTHRAFDDKAYYSAIREEDSYGNTGVTIRRDLLQVAGETLRSNIAILGMKLLPYTEMMMYAFSIMKKKYIDKSTEIHVPNFKRVVQHFCLPVSGKPVIREIGKGLKLGEREMEPALMTLHRFGNQSSSSLWYELGYIEAKERVKIGDRVWQLGMGSGPKCNSLVWECIRPMVGEAHRGPWADCIQRYPVGA